MAKQTNACLSCLWCMLCCTSKNGSICCALFSGIGAIFLGVLGGLLTWQWQYIHGIENSEDADHARTNSFTAAAIYFVLFVMCSVSLVYHNKREQAAIKEQQSSSHNGIELDRINASNSANLDAALMPQDALSGRNGAVDRSSMELR